MLNVPFSDQGGFTLASIGFVDHKRTCLRTTLIGRNRAQLLFLDRGLEDFLVVDPCLRILKHASYAFF